MSDTNPSPPREFDDEAEKFRQDMIGGTAISKKWVYSTLLDLCKEVDKHNTENNEEIVEISDDLQDEACKLWDLCIESDLSLFLIETKAVELISGIIHKSKSPRLTEILMGILGNMACTPQVCISIAKKDDIRQLTVCLLSSRDTPTLVEVGRFLNTSLANKDCRNVWVDTIESAITDSMQDIVFILNSSTNSTVLDSLLKIIDACLDLRPQMVSACLRNDFVDAVAEAGFQILKDDNMIVQCLHILHILSMAENSAAEHILNYGGKACKFSLQCCEKWLGMDEFILGTDPCLVSVASCMSLINFMLVGLLSQKSGDAKSEKFSLADKKTVYRLTGIVRQHIHFSDNEGKEPDAVCKRDCGDVIKTADNKSDTLPASDDKDKISDPVVEEEGGNHELAVQLDVTACCDRALLLDVMNELVITLDKFK